MRLNSRGSVLLQTVLVLSVLTGAFYFINSQLKNQKQIVLETDAVMNVRFTLHSLLDYTLFGLRNRYCFSTTMTQETCSFTHVASSERVMMSQSQADDLRRRLLADPATAALAANDLRLTVFKRTAEISSIPSTHPLFPLLQRVAGRMRGSYLSIEVRRDESSFLPRSGQEVFLRLTASFTDNKGKLLVVGNNQLSLTSYLTVYPREIGSFGLLIAKDLRLDKRFDATMANGDVGIHSFRVENGGRWPSNGVGLTFMSPIFVNQNIHMPTPSLANPGRGKSPDVYTPVTFGGRVFMGNGEIKEAGNSYAPYTAGGENDRLWSENKLIGGFQGGISVDGSLDKGIQVFAGVVAGTPIDSSLMEQCIARSQSKSDAATMLSSRLYANKKTVSSSSVEYRFGITKGNSFSPQSNVADTISNASWGNGTFVRSPNSRGPIFKIRTTLGTRSISAQMLEKGVLTLYPEVASEAYHDTLRAAVVAAETAVPVVPATVNAAKAKLATFEAMLTTNKPKIEIRISDASIGGVGPQPHLQNVKFTFENPTSFLDADGSQVAPKFRINAYDPTFFNSNPIGTENTKLTGRLDFFYDSSVGSFGSPDSLADTNGATLDVPEDTTDYFTLDQRCEQMRGAASSQSFGNASWATDFSPQTRHSWNFAGTSSSTAGADPLIPEIVFDSNNSSTTLANVTYQVRSIAGICRITAGAELVAGMFSCDNLVIESRAKPLRIIGTFIVGKMEIHPSALVSGIRWSSIYHPQATLDLRQAGVLVSKSGRSCSAPALDGTGKIIPSWHPVPSIQEVQDRFSCNTISLRAKASPFRWTTVDPDCGIENGQSNTTCKNRILQFFLLEHTRGGGL